MDVVHAKNTQSGSQAFMQALLIANPSTRLHCRSHDRRYSESSAFRNSSFRDTRQGIRSLRTSSLRRAFPLDLHQDYHKQKADDGQYDVQWALKGADAELPRGIMLAFA